jgi:hypothetical protein
MNTPCLAFVSLCLFAATMLRAQQTNPASASQREADARSRMVARAAANASAVTNLHSFGIFMPREDVLGRTADVTERIRAFYKAAPKDIPVAQYPVISDKDIESYDWKTQTLLVDKAALWRIPSPSVWGAPFVVVVDGQPVYVGAFYTGASSASCPVPVIMTDPFLRQSNTLQIQRAYPGEGVPGQSATDPRTNALVKNALQALGNLRE